MMKTLIGIFICLIIVSGCSRDVTGRYYSTLHGGNYLDLFDTDGEIYSAFSLSYIDNLQHQSAGKNELISYIQNLVLTISLDKNSYLEGEPLWLSFSIKNIGSNRDSLPLLHDERLAKSLVIMDQNGIKKTYLGGQSSYLGKDYKVFEPGETATYIIELEEFFGDQNEGLKAFSPEGCLKEGRYTVESNYKDGKVLLLKSNKLTFEIKKPTGKELGALNTLRTIYQMPENNETEILSKSHALREFYLNYNESVYSGISFFYLSLLIDMSKGIGLEESIINEVWDFLDKYPNFPYIIDIIKLGQIAVDKFRNGSGAVVEYLTEIMRKHPDTKAYYKAEKLLKDVNR